MKLVINTSIQRFGGAIQVALSFIYECIQFPENEYHVFVGPGVGKSLNESDFPSNFTFYHFDFGPVGFSNLKEIQQTLAPFVEKIKPDVMIATSGPTYFRASIPQIIGFNLPLYIYPESPYLKTLPMAKRIKIALRKQLHFYFFKRDASAYVVQTDDVNWRVKKALKTERVFTVTNTHNNFYLNPKTFPPRLPEKEPNVFRWLTLSSYYPHKNLELIPEIVRKLNQSGNRKVEFVLTLKESDFQEKIGAMPGIINVGPVPPEACPSLYSECDGMFLPTLAECFSASYPEAMVMEKPIVTTDLGFARSICGDAAQYFEPKNADDALIKLLEVVENDELQRQLVANGKETLKKFDTAQTRAQKYLEICKEISTL